MGSGGLRGGWGGGENGGSGGGGARGQGSEGNGDLRGEMGTWSSGDCMGIPLGCRESVVVEAP